MTDSKTPLSWRESIQQGNFKQAEARIQALELVGEHHPEMLLAVQAMMGTTEAIRSKQFLKALRYLPDLNPLQEFFSLSDLRMGIETLQQTEKQEERDPETLRSKLQPAWNNPFTRAEALNRIGVLQAQLGDPVQARVAFEEAIQSDPMHFRAITNLGNIALEAGNHNEAEALYRRALELNPEHHLAHNNLAVLLRKQKRIGASIQSLKKSQRLEQKALMQQAREEGRQQAPAAKAGVFALYGVILIGVIWFLLTR
ncbi:tetratricopeptide repeat protein [Deinococcus cellulosilyticus]|uniref:Uncharacterized protein n=1 Tax=Deinococcus cellulosilyticus (strain DSM 18568 / NBRC 106333 / KACC 11606 / 5516J-15) TaxID=1223518 RepID=A0A511NA22_DEIC1|nr:tetratricopeptide repeat protein [Deinococcus cellulosilyticus]GEM49417.1 hypothetical protein DC3_50520 [Deinococcus cellulosilyticus NBRC 106333 = KACC 11606]